MKTAFAIAALAVSALYLYNQRSSPQSGGVAKNARLQTRLATTPAQAVALQPNRSAAANPGLTVGGTSPAHSASIVVAPMPKIRLNTGPNAQTDLKTGPNAQNMWNQASTGPTALKTGPNAQTALTMKRSW